MNLEAARSLLFVPGDRPDRFAKAEAGGADGVVLDLEDAVGAGHKAEAREHVRAWLAEGHPAIVRVNAPGTPWFADDVTAVGSQAVAVMVPKAEDPSALPQGVPVIPLLETALGIARANSVCAAPAVVRPAFGSVDLAAQLGVDHRSHEALRHARSAVVLAAAAAGRPGPIDGVTTAVDDAAALSADIAEAVLLGFTAKLCIHPRQVEAVRRGFAPSAADVEWARGVLAAASEGSVAVYEGQMVDRPVVLRAEAVLARAE
ncbi:HpcH/HpaI aldolase/citrate lyase family protein [Amycolatopsis jiangsuensis]|uniref:Citrate lyase subunit beta/citryl-CoA lyase n=1 Tax=Amycolatopsis jiangsuensis TaxID=1181879 RepID=A0A840J6L0_9PSEU|nr:CoA ester lyase [Amycolatopsis jiangsuensis]MBB4689044.1 citrate lyase subunit beta/citryl-CoA lyase [Amycolatopsis jiangsuensis]